MLNKLKQPKTCLFVQATRPICRYLLVERSSPIPRIQAVGYWEVDDHQPLIEQLQEQLETQDIRCRQAVLLLPRADLEVSSHQLPPATNDELPELVQNAVAAELGDTGGTYASDFLVPQQDVTGCEVLTFSLSDQRSSDFKHRFKAAGLNLLAITLTGLGAVKLLQRVVQRPASTAVTVAIGDADIDLAVTENGRPLLFRSIPCSSEEDRVRAERLSAEIRRTLALVHRGDDDSTRLYLLGDVAELENLAQLLAEQLSVSASVVNPLAHIESAANIESSAQFANLIGVACAWSGEDLDLDLLNPRRAPRKAGPWRRAAFWGAVAATIFLGASMVAWQNQADQIDAINKQKDKLESLAKRASKARGLQDVADATNAWRRDDIAWLDELRELSSRLPSGEEALIRRMSVSTDSAGNGVIDLAMQVSQPEVVANLENAIRDALHSVSSKRVTESDQKSQLPWSFETRITFTPTDLPELPLPEEIAEDESPAASDSSIVAEVDPKEGGSPK